MDGSDLFAYFGTIAMECPDLSSSGPPKSRSLKSRYVRISGTFLLCSRGFKPRAALHRSDGYRSMYPDLTAQTCSSVVPFLHCLDTNPRSRSSWLIRRQLCSLRACTFFLNLGRPFQVLKGLDLCFFSL
jgi:hypothetical protein